jgi:site-specific DNA-methyltransferase (adenine-specific)
MLHGNATDLPIDDGFVDCIVTSPPYNVRADYADVDDGIPLSEYRAMSEGSAREMHRVLKPGGRVWLNVVQATNQLGDPGREAGERFNLLSLWMDALACAGLGFRDVVVWDKTIGNQATAWGSYLSPNAPNLRGRWEPVLSYFKSHWSRRSDFGPSRDLIPEEWMSLTRNVWSFPPDGRNRWHPAPFPEELPRRCILLSTWPGDLVVDPFAGSGTTLRAAHALSRNAIGIELSRQYVRRWHEHGVQEVLPA